MSYEVASRRVPAVVNQTARVALGTEAETWRRYPVLFGLILRGDVDERLLAGALTAVLRRHSGFRYFFPKRQTDGFAECAEPRSLSFPLDVVDLSEASTQQAIAQERHALDKLRQPFEFSIPPLARALLIRHVDRHVLGIAVDHAIFDAASVGAFLADLQVVWNRLAAGVDATALESEVSDFVRFAEAEQTWLDGPKGMAALEFWRLCWPGKGPYPGLPLPAADSDSDGGGSWERRVSAAELAERCGEMGGLTTPFMLIAGALFTALRASTGQTDLGLIFPVSRRNNAMHRRGIGYYNNQLLLRVRLDGEVSLINTTKAVSRATLGALRHAMMPYHRLKDRFPAEASDNAPYLYLNMLPVPEQPKLAGVTAEFTWFDQEDVLAGLPRLNVICQSRSDETLSIRAGHDGGHFRWADVKSFLDYAFEIMTA